MAEKKIALKDLLLQRIAQFERGTVWMPIDFFDLGTRAVVDKALPESPALFTNNSVLEKHNTLSELSPAEEPCVSKK